MDTLTLKIPGSIKEKLKIYSKNKGISKSEIVRNALFDYLDGDDLESHESFYELAKDLAGIVESSPDLSTNKEYLSEYGK